MQIYVNSILYLLNKVFSMSLPFWWIKNRKKIWSVTSRPTTIEVSICSQFSTSYQFSPTCVWALILAISIWFINFSLYKTAILLGRDKKADTSPKQDDPRHTRNPPVTILGHQPKTATFACRTLKNDPPQIPTKKVGGKR